LSPAIMWLRLAVRSWPNIADSHNFGRLEAPLGRALPIARSSFSFARAISHFALAYESDVGCCSRMREQGLHLLGVRTLSVGRHGRVTLRAGCTAWACGRRVALSHASSASQPARVRQTRIGTAEDSIRTRNDNESTVIVSI